MSVSLPHDGGLMARLPSARGKLTPNAALAPLTWLRVGGPAEVLFRPADLEDLCAFLAAKPEDVPVTVIGVGSNLLVRDGGVPGVVIRLGRAFARIDVAEDSLEAGAAALDAEVANAAAAAGRGGLEFLSGIPGTVGGGLRMNAGAFGGEFKDVLIAASAVDAGGRRHEVAVADLGLSYRHSDAPADWLFVAARFRAPPAPTAVIAERLAAIAAQRTVSQPQRVRTGGSTFANPGPDQRAWQLIDQAGCRGLRRGGAMVSELHANFLINVGDATAAEVEGLGEEVRRRVFETSGVTLRWEIRRIGVPLSSLAAVP